MWNRCTRPTGPVWLLFALTLMMSTTPTEAQEATITIEGYAYGQIAGIAHECPLREMPNGRYRVDGYVGLQISCPIWAVDAED